MISLQTISFMLVGLTAAWLLTAWVRRYALQSSLLDHPNERSSHTRPTPRGGGIGFVLSFLALAMASLPFGLVDAPTVAAMVGGGGLVAVLGYLDDRRGLPARWRFLGHLAAAAWMLSWLPPLPALPVLGSAIPMGPAAPLLAALYVAWMINLFNFMDGIDGIASVEAVLVAVGGALAWWLAAPQPAASVPLLFASCVAGFLLWNFPPAKIFMGDAGSGFLGALLGFFALWSSLSHPPLFWSWMVLVGCFMVDATTTLLRRVARGERFYEAHRSHAYQYASRRHGGHLPVTLAFGALTAFWLIPLACMIATGWLDGLAGVALAYAPLVWLAIRYKAGDRASQVA